MVQPIAYTVAESICPLLVVTKQKILRVSMTDSSPTPQYGQPTVLITGGTC